MTIEAALVISVLSLTSALYFNIWNKNRNSQKDADDAKKEVKAETKQETAANTMVMIKLEMISEDLKEIKSENKNFREDISTLRERMAKVESSLKSYHKRIDGEKTEE